MKKEAYHEYYRRTANWDAFRLCLCMWGAGFIGAGIAWLFGAQETGIVWVAISILIGGAVGWLWSEIDYGRWRQQQDKL